MSFFKLITGNSRPETAISLPSDIDLEDTASCKTLKKKKKKSLCEIFFKSRLDYRAH